MPGNYAKPFRLPPAGNIVFTYPNHLSGCDVVPKWSNVTQARYPGPVVGAPGSRVDAWLLVGDLNGLSSQTITDLVNDIIACGGAPVVSTDHNCYSLSDSKLSFKKCHKVGGKWVNAQKFWHGSLGFVDDCDPMIPSSVTLTTDPSITINSTFITAPPQIHYLTGTCAATSTSSHWSYTADPPVIDDVVTGDANGTHSVDRLTGINHKEYDFDFGTATGGGPGPSAAALAFGWATQHDILSAAEYFSGWDYLIFNGFTVWPDHSYFTISGSTITAMSGAWTVTDGPETIIYPDSLLEKLTVDVAGGTFYRKTMGNWEVPPPPPGWNGTDPYTVTAYIKGPFLIESSTVTNTSVTFHQEDYEHVRGVLGGWDTVCDATYSLSVPYTSTDCYGDWLAAINAWDMTSDTLYPWRTDEELANAPWIFYDEVGPTPLTPPFLGGNTSTDQSGSGPTMNDYTKAQNPDSSWPQRAWIDEANYFWTGPTGSTNTISTAGGNILKTPMRTGAIISHNPAGYDRHCWFGITNYTVSGSDLVVTGYGNFTDAALPAAARRWMDVNIAQYNSSITNSQGNLPQAWLREQRSTLMGGKYVQTKEIWNSVNFGRPYGADLFAVDQTTVNWWDGSTLTPTANALTPLATGVAMVGGDGVYNITVTGSTFTKGAKIAGIPAGCDIGAGYVGNLRFWGAPPFGLLAAVGVFDGAKTTFTIPETPYWVSLSGAAITLSVDLYAAASNGNPASPSLATVTLTKASAGDLYATTPGDYSAAVFIIPHLHYSGAQFKPEYDDNRPKGDFVQIGWNYNFRALDSRYPSPPSSVSATTVDANIRMSPCCPSVVGIAPSSPFLEQFRNQNLVGMPTGIAFDDYYGAAWMGAVQTTMSDPFWQQPFAPNGLLSSQWVCDTGFSNPTDDVPAGVSYYPAPPLVEARSTYPNNLGWEKNETPPTMPTGCKFEYDATTGVQISGSGIDPRVGIPGTGTWSNVATDYGTYLAACADIAVAGRFTGIYQTWCYC